MPTPCPRRIPAPRHSDEGEVALGVAARVQLTALGLGFEIGFNALAPAHFRA